MSDAKQIMERLVRIETRQVQMMLHMGMDPYNPVYTTQRGGPTIAQRNTQYQVWRGQDRS